MTLTSGTLRTSRQRWEEETLPRGVKLVLVQSGRLRCRIPGQSEQVMEGPSLCIIANDGDFSSTQLYGTREPLRYTIVQLGREALDQDQGFLPAHLHWRPGSDPRMAVIPAPRTLRALALQIATCQDNMPARDLYLGAKTMELAALSARLLSSPQDTGRRLGNSDTERLHRARELLTEDLQTPPSLHGLAAQAGMSTRKLTAGFRSLFGTSVFGYLQEYRLQEARRLLCEEALPVSTVAHRVGYSPAHFSTVFRKRFGISPGDLR
ncbi:transcriptional regulator PchR [Alcanivorax xiamenensis]|uniref:Transcriptional regulator PchR n=2 Tax=Alcanivorax xiamenensis TaxID=1177156 RepID=A0ABQ6YC62_9GAMM|nr:transcriptional regulator PchR [Alcanivorax xiamenensis]